MFAIFENLLLKISLSIALGYWIATSWFKYTEFIGIILLIGQTVLSIQNHQDKNEFSIKL